MKRILVTGGCGYIGSHTIVDLVEHGFEVVSVDNLSRGFAEMNTRISNLLAKDIYNHVVDLSDAKACEALFEEIGKIDGIIHFAAYKSVPESVSEPLKYYQNNLGSLNNLLACAEKFGVNNFVFSSSCSVYGNTEMLPVSEEAPFLPAESPYAHTKQIGEEICRSVAAANAHLNVVLLRYFNPAGAHVSTQIGELNKLPENLVPIVTQTAIGIRPSMTVFGDDYDTRDGSCVRDYIHVSDIARAHTLAVEKALEGALPTNCEVFNLGTGSGVTVLELIHSFEKVSGLKLNYSIGPRRAGDVIQIYANNQKATEMLGWTPAYGIEKMMETAWAWEQSLAKD